jgi:hypothetical protein
VLFRRALALYVIRLERLLSAADAGKLDLEAYSLRRAAKGASEGLPEEQLLATPPRPFSAIVDEARRLHSERAKANIFTPFNPDEEPQP